MISSHVKFWVVNDCSLGFAYIAVAKQFYQLKWLIVIHHRKLIYATHWTNWILNNKITDVMEKDTMAGFYDLRKSMIDVLCFDCFHKD
jgi:hypothetical protein